VGGNPIGQKKILSEKVLLAMSEILDVFPILCPTDNGGYGYKLMSQA